jgi:hypothetical protein
LCVSSRGVAHALFVAENVTSRLIPGAFDGLSNHEIHEEGIDIKVRDSAAYHGTGYRDISPFTPSVTPFTP